MDNYSSQVGYGFSVELLEEDDANYSKAWSFYETCNRDLTLNECYVEIVGDFREGSNIDLVVFLNSHKPVELNTEFFGSMLLNEEIDISEPLAKEIQKLKEYVKFLNDKPQPIIAFDIS